MRRLLKKIAVVAVAFMVTVGLVWAEDEVQRRATSVPLRGTITGETANEITIQRKDNGKTETVSVHELAKIKYEGGKAAAEFTQAESLERGNEYQKASDAYAKLAQEYSSKEFLVRAANFGRANTLVRHAQRDASKADDAIKALEDFRKQNPNSRFHYTLHEMLGQLHFSQGNSDAAGTAFAELAKAPWPDFQLKATNYEGRLLVVGSKLDAAIGKFDEVLKSSGDSAEEKLRRFEAQVGKGECLVKQKKYDEAEKILQDVIDSCSSEETSIHAATFNLLGDLYRETGKNKDALIRYLQVHMLYSGDRNEHAKSLCYLAILWDQLGRADRAADIRERLKQDYPSSPWIKVMESGAKAEPGGSGGR